MCGVIGVSGHSKAAVIVRDAMFAQQHRGEEACGMAVEGPGTFHAEKYNGLVMSHFAGPLERFPGMAGIGHTRYVTAGSGDERDAQPFWYRFKDGRKVALASNGDLPSIASIHEQLAGSPWQPKTQNDAEALLGLICMSIASGRTVSESLRQVVRTVPGAYSLVVLAGEEVYAVRDRFGFRPLVIGRFDGEDGVFCVASETSALDTVRARHIRSVSPGEVVCIRDGTLESCLAVSAPRLAQCLFELIYFARPDARVFGVPVAAFRRELGVALAQDDDVKADVVVGIPDSAMDIAQGYAEAGGLPLRRGLVRSHYVGRTFIAPSEGRNDKVRLKYNPVLEDIAGHDIVVIDDSIVRGTTMRRLVKIIRGCEPRSVHLRIGSPPIRYTCHMGIDTPDPADLIAASQTVDEIRTFMSADSLRFLSEDALRGVAAKFGLGNTGCFACFNGKYGMEIPPSVRKSAPPLAPST